MFLVAWFPRILVSWFPPSSSYVLSPFSVISQSFLILLCSLHDSGKKRREKVKEMSGKERDQEGIGRQLETAGKGTSLISEEGSS